MASIPHSHGVGPALEAGFISGLVGLIIAFVLVGGIVAYQLRHKPLTWRVGGAFLAGALSGGAVGSVIGTVAYLLRDNL